MNIFSHIHTSTVSADSAAADDLLAASAADTADSTAETNSEASSDAFAQDTADAAAADNKTAAVKNDDDKTIVRNRRRRVINIIRGCIGLLCFFLMPYISFCLFETVTGNLSNINDTLVFYNTAFNLCLYLAVFGISGSTRISIPLVSIPLLILSVAETFVVDFRSRPIMLSDLTAFSTAMTVADNYVFEFTDAMKQSAAIIAGLNVIALLCPFRVRRLRARAALFAACAFTVTGFCYDFYTRVRPANFYDINSWDPESSYESDGYVFATFLSLRYVVKQAPSGYSQAKLKAIVDAVEADSFPTVSAASGSDDASASNGSSDAGSDSYANADSSLSASGGGSVGSAASDGSAASGTEAEAETAITPVNIICIMNESFSDLSVAGNFTTNIDYMPFWNSLTENTVRGSLCVPVFGSMTSNTEAEFLTGDAMALLPFNSNAYQFNIKPGALSLVSTLKSQGYRAVAMHPYPAENWNRKRVYEYFGFDEFYDIEEYELDERLRNYVCDASDFAQLIHQVEIKDSPEDKLFLFNVTMQNHGGYAEKHDNFDQEVWLTGELEGKYPEADQYLSLIKRTDAAFEGLINYFSSCDQPTMIVMFGDHQPAVEDEFFNEIAGISGDEIPAEDRLIWYQTPFVIWTNYEQPSENMGKLSAMYLSSYVLKLSGLELTPYNKYLLKLSQDVPVIHPLGCYDLNGTYYPWALADTTACPYGDEILNYEYLAYNHSMDTKKYTRAFSLSEAFVPD